MKQTRDIVKKVKDTISRHRMIEQGDHVIAAVSGGPDSMCMLHILHILSRELGIRLTAAHLEHGWRPDEDVAETELVKKYSGSLGIPFESKSITPENRGSLEEAAREARYEFLEDVLEAESGDKIATGHTLNDQAETLIIRLLRGSGVSGLAGIPPVRDNRIIRPIMDLARDDIEEYLKYHNIPFALDKSNMDRTFLRNSIRLELLPKMLEYEPNLIPRLGRLADILREEDHYMNQQARLWAESSVLTQPDGSVSVLLNDFLELPDALKNRVIRYLLKRIHNGLRRIGYDHIAAIRKLAEGNRSQGTLDLPNAIIAEKTYERLIFSIAGKNDPVKFEYVIKETETLLMKRIGKRLLLETLESLPEPKAMKSNRTAYVDADRVIFPLKVRNFRPGDRFMPLGMNGRRKIKDFFMDLKIPSRERCRIPILFSEDNVVWICGYRLDERYKITPETKRFLKITIC